MAKIYDILVIGAGPGGHAAAVQAARQGARAAIIERREWGSPHPILSEPLGL